jgi:hypothetical protein
MCRTGNYTLFMQRYADATRMAPYLMDALLPKIRAGVFGMTLSASQHRVMLLVLS